MTSTDTIDVNYNTGTY